MTDRGLLIIFSFLFIVGTILFYALGFQHGYNKCEREVDYYLSFAREE